LWLLLELKLKLIQTQKRHSRVVWFRRRCEGLLLMFFLMATTTIIWWSWKGLGRTGGLGAILFFLCMACFLHLQSLRALRFVDPIVLTHPVCCCCCWAWSVRGAYQESDQRNVRQVRYEPIGYHRGERDQRVAAVSRQQPNGGGREVCVERHALG